MTTTQTAVKPGRLRRVRSAMPARWRASARPPADEIDLSTLFRILLRRLPTIVLVLALFLGAGYAYLKTTPPLFEASSRVLVDPRQKQVIGTDIDNPRFGVDPAWIESQADVVLSTRTLAIAIAELGLNADPWFGGAPDDGLDAAARAARDAIVMGNLREAIRVERADRTYVFEITATTGDPEKSARIATSVAHAFVTVLIDAKSDTVRQANELLSRQLETLRQKSREADEKLETYRREKGILAAEGFLVDEATLRQLNEASVAAGLAAEKAEERLKRITAARSAGASRFDSLLDTASSAILSRLNIEYGLAARRLAELERQLGPSHPRLEGARADVARSRQLIDEELKGLEETARLDFEIARATEENTRARLGKARTQMSDTGENSITLRELESDANIRREIYKAFMTRAEETALQEDVQISDARVLNEATPPERAASPKKSVVLGLAGLIGLGLGMALALYRGRRDVALLLGPRDPVDPGPRPESGRDRDREQDAGPTAPSPVQPLRPQPVWPSARSGATSAEDGFDAQASDRPDVPTIGMPEDRPIAPDGVPPAPPTTVPAGIHPAVVPPHTASDAAPVLPAAAASPTGSPPVGADPLPWPKVSLPPDFPVPVFARIGLSGATAGIAGPAAIRLAVGRAVEKRPGVASRPGLAAFRPVLDSLRPAAPGRPPLVSIGGLGDPLTVAALAYGLANAASARRERVLLVDAAAGPVRLADGFFRNDEPGILEVVAGAVDPEDILSVRETPNLSILAAASRANAADLSARASTVAVFLAGLAKDFDRTVVCLGSDLQAALVHAVADVSTDVLFAIEADHAADETVIREAGELHHHLPNFTGVLLVDRLPAVGEASAS